MSDKKDLNKNKSTQDPLTPLNISKKSKKQVAVALEDSRTGKELPRITAAGRGKIAEQILQMAFDNDIKVREDGALAEMLASIELESPIPTEAFMAVAEILSYVYRANGEPNPFDAVLEEMEHEPDRQQEHKEEKKDE